jgi:hypothetical protein
MLALGGAISLAGCHNDTRQVELLSSTSVAESKGSSAGPAVDPEALMKEESIPIAKETRAPIETVDTPDDSCMVDEGKANANVLYVKAQLADNSTWTFTVTVEHPDTGWEDYADGWDVVLPDGRVIKPDLESSFTRLLLHPHETEQPFTRSQSGITIPLDIEWVTVRAHELVDGFGGKEVVVNLSVSSGPDFEVSR